MNAGNINAGVTQNPGYETSQNQAPGDPQADMSEVYTPSDEIMQVLWMRVDGLTPQEIAMLDRAITPETAPVLVKIFPELEAMIRQASVFTGQQQPGMPSAAPQGQGVMPTGIPAGGGAANGPVGAPQAQMPTGLRNQRMIPR